MNIHILDKQLFERLKEISLIRVRVGSHMYGMDTKDSDIDYLYLYVKPQGLMASFLWEHHQLQYKEDGIDHNFTDIQSFIRNIMTGDSTINFEALHSEEFKNDSRFGFLYDNRKWFYSYNVIRSYLGLARRDLSMCTKVLPKTNGINYKKLYHSARGMMAAEYLMKGVYENVVSDLFRYNYLRKIKEEEFSQEEAKSAIAKISDNLFDIRKELNKRFEEGLIPRAMDVRHMELLDFWLRGFVDQYQKEFNLDCGYFYNVLEKGIKYE